MKKRVFGLVLGLVISALFLWATLHRVDLDAVAKAATGASLPVLSLCVVMRTFGFLFMAARTRTLLKPLVDASGRSLLAAHLVGFAGNVALPFRMGELLRIEHMARHQGVAPSSLLALVGLERLLDAFMLLVILLLTLPLAAVDLPLPGSVALVATGVTVAGGAALLLSHRPELLLRPVAAVLGAIGGPAERLVMPRARMFADGLKGLASPRSVALVLLWTAGYWGTGLVSVRLWLLAFGLDLPFVAPGLVVVSSAFGTAVPAAPGFVGTYHFSVTFALGLLGVARDVGVSVALVGHALSMVPGAVVGLVVLAVDQARRRGRSTGAEAPDEV